ncbi:hypothetical protein [Streptomyces cathayae]|uniref:Uncharacterized protein n=2 Tax=Streptomyces TaxID=1883 RepID=A0ABY8JWU5_9ACTN|nr:hypothetical protein [Streptomyces sp. HUAS 5]WGD39040.1 hypothetical protein PYS65_02005 [Streptomyces sp. HUAS 5]
MDAERARRMVELLRARGVMAHLVEAGVYEFGIRVVLDEGVEALWDIGGVAGLDAEIVDEGVLIGFVPHVPGSENYTEQQLVDSIATTDYSLEGLHPPTDGPPGAPPPEPGSPAGGDLPYPDAPPPGAPPIRRDQRRAHWIRRGRR